MKKIDNKDLKKVSGGKAWHSALSDGKTYFLDKEAYDILEANGYHLGKSTCTGIPSLTLKGILPCEVTDNKGNGIGDATMQNLLGSPISL